MMNINNDDGDDESRQSKPREMKRRKFVFQSQREKENNLKRRN